jgi:hypothetical protein
MVSYAFIETSPGKSSVNACVSKRKRKKNKRKCRPNPKHRHRSAASSTPPDKKFFFELHPLLPYFRLKITKIQNSRGHDSQALLQLPANLFLQLDHGFLIRFDADKLFRAQFL